MLQSITSPINKTPQQKQRGFSLIEILFVMLIIGMLMSVVVLSIGDGNRRQQVQGQARALYQALQLAVSEAVFYRRQLGVRFDLDTSDVPERWRYQFMLYDPELKLWQLIETDDLAEHELMPGLTLSLSINQEEVMLGDIEKQDRRLFELDQNVQQQALLEPDIYFLSSGETQNFVLQLIDNGVDAQNFSEPNIYTIKANFMAQFEFLLPGQTEDE